MNKYKIESVLDIGSNDGTLLEGFKNQGFKVLGVEPTNIAKLANKKGSSGQKALRQIIRSDGTEKTLDQIKKEYKL